jgi:hypothetical protein
MVNGSDLAKCVVGSLVGGRDRLLDDHGVDNPFKRRRNHVCEMRVACSNFLEDCVQLLSMGQYEWRSQRGSTCVANFLAGRPVYLPVGQEVPPSRRTRASPLLDSFRLLYSKSVLDRIVFVFQVSLPRDFKLVAISQPLSPCPGPDGPLARLQKAL